jgi:hypothetical protein
LPSRCRRVSPRLTGDRLEPSELADGLPFEPVDDANVHGGAGDPHLRQLLLERLQATERPWQLAVAELMTDAERVMADHWARVEQAAEAAGARDGLATRRG